MNYLEGVQALHREAKLPGSPPSAVTSQVGRAADLVAWYAEAWNDIQRENDGRWLWLRKPFTFDTTADDSEYAYGDVDDADLSSPITRFRAWHLDTREPPLIYLVSDGQATQRQLSVQHWFDFRAIFRFGTHTAAYPDRISSTPAGKLVIGPTPDDEYRITGDYWRSNQTLAADDDEPEMPEDYHMLIVYRAILKYGYNAVAREVLSRVAVELPPLYNALRENQGWHRFSWTTSGALA